MRACFAIYLFVCLLCVGCGRPQSQATSDAKIPVLPDAKVPVPPFQIKISLTAAATAKLQSAGESIKGGVIFDGDGQSKPGEDTGAGRAVGLGDYSFERVGAGVISVTNALISKEAFQRLSDTNYYYTINVFSGRRVFTNNILDGGYAIGHISDAVKEPIQITCDLIFK
jgi:hypothetical protein